MNRIRNVATFALRTCIGRYRTVSVHFRLLHETSLILVMNRCNIALLHPKEISLLTLARPTDVL